MMNKGEFYKHRYSMDVILEVTSIIRADEKGIDIYGRFWNQGWTGRPWLIDDSPELIHIKYDQIENWKEMNWEEMTRRRIND